MKPVNRISVTAFGIALFLLGLQAADQKNGEEKAGPSPKINPAVAASAAPANAGVVVVKDQETGQLRQATPEEIGALSNGNGGVATPKAAVATPTVVVRPDGLMSVQLGPDQMSYSVVTRTADGKLVEGCVTGENAAKKAVLSAVPQRSAAKEKWDEK